MQGNGTTLDDIVAEPSDASKRRFSVVLGPLEIRLLPHGQGFREAREI
jgi:hypothetical protein